MIAKVTRIVLLLSLLLYTAPTLSAQNKNDKKGENEYEEMTIKPGIQWDTAIVIKQTHNPEHLIGIRYNYGFTGVSITPDLSI